MTARPPIAQFGDAIEVKGERPSWLPDDVYVRWYGSGMTDEWWYDRYPKGIRAIVTWRGITAIRLEVPRYDFVYLALERGMVPWFGNRVAPVEAQLVDVLHRDGRVVTGLWSHRLDWFHYTQHSTDNAIIGYHATSTALPLAHPAAPQGEEVQVDIAAIQAVTVQMRRLMPNACGDWADQIDAALAPAAIASGRGEG